MCRASGAHAHLGLKFDRAFIDSWDSLDGACCAPDILFVTIDGTEYQWTVNHAAGHRVPYLAIRFGGAGFKGGIDESWGIDNFALSAIFERGDVIPEPATWAMMIAGFGLVGAAARQRRPAAA